MLKKYPGRGICPGLAEGEALVTRQSISFLGGVDSETGEITEVDHELQGKSMAGKILILPSLKGSAGGMWILIRLAKSGKGPLGIIVSRADTILVGAVIMAEIPTIDSIEAPIHGLKSGQKIKIDGGKGEMEIMA